MSADIEVVTVRLGDPLYEELLGSVREDRALLDQMWADAESHLDEKPAKMWSIATAQHDGRPIAAAWVAAIEIEHEGQRMLRCLNNYEVPAWRGRGLYEAAYHERHRAIVLPSEIPAITWIFDQPRTLHELDGWKVTDSGWSHEPGVESHEWFEMRRP